MDVCFLDELAEDGHPDARLERRPASEICRSRRNSQTLIVIVGSANKLGIEARMQREGRGTILRSDPGCRSLASDPVRFLDHEHGGPHPRSLNGSAAAADSAASYDNIVTVREGV